MTHSWIDSSAALDALLLEHQGAAWVAVDTEFRRRDTFYPQVALVQLCWGEHAYLVDPLNLTSTASLKHLLGNPTQVKFVHSASEDLEVFSHWLGVLPMPLFDTQRAAALVGLGAGLSYRALVAAFFDINLPKDETQSDWLQRPLSSQQMTYAAQDVSYLLPIGVKLLEKTQEMGRYEWALEEGARMQPGGKAPISKFKSAYKLSGKQQCALTAIVGWREREARRLDRPRSWILSDKLVSAAARTVPESTQSLAAIPDMPNGLVRRAGEALVAEIQRTIKDLGADLSQVAPPPLAAAERKWLPLLSEQLGAIAKDLNIAPEVLMPKADLEHMIRQLANPSLPPLPAWSGWRQETVVAVLQASLVELYRQ